MLGRTNVKKHALSVLSISALSVAGTASRIALLNVTKSNNWFPQYPTAAVNVLGTLLIGMLIGFTPLKKVAPDVFIGMTVGFCGSFTTFSSWIVDIMNKKDAVVDVVAGIGLPLVAFLVGRDATAWMPWGRDSEKHIFNDIFCVTVFAACVTTVAVLGGIHGTETISPGDVIAVSLSPIGADRKSVV